MVYFYTKILKSQNSMLSQNTGMHTREGSRKIFKVPNDNLDVSRFERPYQSQSNEIPNTRKKKTR